ncbi:hypothetical protein J6590_033043 [Homalodisca vitripennis]|nr:hypothetical protein J6590_033043 [Homalodisca vitripennis]
MDVSSSTKQAKVLASLATLLVSVESRSGHSCVLHAVLEPDFEEEPHQINKIFRNVNDKIMLQFIVEDMRVDLAFGNNGWGRWAAFKDRKAQQTPIQAAATLYVKPSLTSQSQSNGPISNSECFRDKDLGSLTTAYKRLARNST